MIYPVSVQWLGLSAISITLPQYHRSLVFTLLHCVSACKCSSSPRWSSHLCVQPHPTLSAWHCLWEPALLCSAPGLRSYTAAAHWEASPALQGLGPCCCSRFLFSRCAHAHWLQTMQRLAVVCNAMLLHYVQLCTQAIRFCLKLIHCKCQSLVPVSKSDAGVAGYWAVRLDHSNNGLHPSAVGRPWFPCSGWSAGSCCRGRLCTLCSSWCSVPGACSGTVQKGSCPNPFLSTSVHSRAEPCFPALCSTVARTLSPLKYPGLLPGASYFLCLQMY